MRRNVALGSNTVVFAAIAIGIAVVVNLISIKHNKKFDLTEQGFYTLAPQSVKALASLRENVTVYAFVRPEERRHALDLLEMYDYESDRLSVKVIDPDREPALARKYKVEAYGTYVAETGSGRREVTAELSEEAITNAILKATTTDEKRVYVLGGHGERSLDDTNPLGWSGAKTALEASAYKVKSLDWFAEGGIPDDADLLVIPGPKNDFQDAEIERLRERLGAGGATLITLDPGELPELEKLMADYGFKFHDDMILDPLSQRLGFDPLVATVTEYGDHPVVNGFRAATFFPVARSMDVEDGGGRSLKVIGKTHVQSWGETDVKSIEKGEPIYADGEDLPGPRVIAASAEWDAGPPKEERNIGEKAKKARVIVTGDSDFASNATLGLSGNKDLFMNMIGWLLEQEDRVAIRPRAMGFNPILFTSGQLKTIFWTAVVAIPAMALIAGVAVRLVRRRG